MSLRLKLLLVALSTLTLPWAGWQLVRQTEALLREGQEQSLLASANTLARALAALDVAAPTPGSSLYVHARTNELRIDGYASDWQAFRADAQMIGGDGGSDRLRVMLAADAQWLYLFAEVRDATRMRADARDAAVAVSDYLDLSFLRGNETRRYRVASAAPGSFDAPAIDGEGNFPDRLTGEWQEDGSGYSIELRIARALAPERIGFAVHDSAAKAALVSEPRFLLGYSDDIAGVLARLAPEHAQVRLFSADGWLVAAGGELDPATVDTEKTSLFGDWIYRTLLASATVSANAVAIDAGAARLEGDLRAALASRATTRWRADFDGSLLLAAAVPLRVGGEARGALVLELANPLLPLLANRALSNLLVASLLALLVSAGLLLLFGGVLSLRIRRLRNATERATSAGGRLAGPLPLSDAHDELGDLARSFGRLFDEVGAYTDYLRTLASKLSHELNTPLAIVKSSLDNLEHQVLPDGARAYLGRARDGVERLGTIVRAMSEANRVERAISSAEAEDFDLRALVAGCADGYRAVAGSRQIGLQGVDAPCPFHGAPELLAQALDKLFDNARSFTPEHGSIVLSLEAGGNGARIRMSNQGPLLPATMQERLFDTLVSVREHGARSGGETPHLGLGLYVVRLIAELHRGHASAHNLDDGSGVAFVLDLRGMPRRRLTGSEHETP